MAGEYVVGWAKRGPTGRIGNNKTDAISTVEVMVADLPDLKGVRDDQRDPSGIEAVLRRRGIDYTTYHGWRVLDGHELALGASQGRPGSRSAASRRCWRSSTARVDSRPVM